jgi:hypothetical protein
MGGRFTIFLAVVAITCLVPGQGVAEESRLDQIEKRVEQLEQRTKQDIGPGTYVLPGLSLVALAVFCALWARGTGRDPWLWLAAGLVFNFFTLFAIWIKHEHDQKKKTRLANLGGDSGFQAGFLAQQQGKPGQTGLEKGYSTQVCQPRKKTQAEQVESSDQIRK